tara:strand:+ start:697 stop:1824 length:1128 start_codon:yes stop_codon:yes gene_type:complete
MAGERINQEAIETINPFAGPVPGESLTSSPESSQAWEQPPAYTSVREATQDIFLNLLEDEMLETVVTMLANGTPVGDITKMLLVSGLSQGKFNPDLMLLLVEPVMYMILAIAERVGIKDIKLYRGEEDEPEPLDQEETEIYLNESAAHKNSIRNPREESFANLKVNNIGANQVDQELINQLENIDVSGLREKIGLMARPEQAEQGTESLMSREGFALGGIVSRMTRKLLTKHRKDKVVKVLKKEVEEADQKLKKAKMEYEQSAEDFYADGTKEGFDFDAGGGEQELLWKVEGDRQKLAYQLEKRVYELEKKENPDIEYFVKEKDFIEETDPNKRRPGYLDRAKREMDERQLIDDRDLEIYIPFSKGGLMSKRGGG